jgi:hypothetical protein
MTDRPPGGQPTGFTPEDLARRAAYEAAVAAGVSTDWPTAPNAPASGDGAPIVRREVTPPEPVRHLGGGVRPTLLRASGGSRRGGLP